MIIHVYKTKQDLLKSCRLEEPDKFILNGKLGGERINVTTIPFKKYYFTKHKCSGVAKRKWAS